MKEILLTSSALILAVVVLRLLFRSKVSRKLIYGAWLLVALRLLIPIQFGQLDFSILTQVEPVTEAITDMAQKPVSGPSREEVYTDTLHDYISQGQSVFIPEVQEQVESEIQHSGRPAVDVYDEILESAKPESVVLPEVNQQIEIVVEETVRPTLGQIALVVWITGMVAMAAWFLGVNLAFRRNLRNAAPSPEPGCKTPVKISAAIASPCVFGLLRPVIYLTPNCAENERIRRHVLTHEQTHLRHGDHIWAWVRCLCLCVYWFNPLVWVAASLSKRDCELACDEAALKILGEGERLAYGKTLVDMVSSVPAPGQLLETATAMHETKKQLKERVKCIVKQPKVFLTAAIALLLVLTIVTGCAFTGTVTDTDETTQPTTERLPKELALSTYDTGYNGTVINDEILMDLYAQAKTILLEYTEVILPNSDLFHLAQENYPSGVRKDDESIIIDTTNPDVVAQPKYAQHVIVLYFLCEFKCVFPINDATFPYFDRYLGNTFFLYSGPLDKGFSDLKAYCEAIWLKGHTGSKYSYFISADNLTIHRGSALGLDIFNAILNGTATPPATDPPSTNVPADRISLEDIPIITQTSVLPENPTMGDVLREPYIGSVRWNSPTGTERQFSISLPLLEPFSDDAKSINEDIRGKFQPIIEAVRKAADNGAYNSHQAVRYSAYLYDNLLSIIITEDDATDGSRYYAYNIDISSGKQLSVLDMIQRCTDMSYPEFLSCATYTVYAYFSEQASSHADALHQLENDTIAMTGYRLAFDGEGKLTLCSHYLNAFSCYIALPFDPNTQDAGIQSSLTWLINRKAEGIYADALSILLTDSFFGDPEPFLEYLSQCDDSVIQEISLRIVFDLHPSEFDSFKALCNQYLSSNTTAKAAKALLDAFKKRS